jgi:hypothetical protein
LKNSADKVEMFSYPRELRRNSRASINLSQDMIVVDKEEQKLVAKEIFKSATASKAKYC